MLVDAGHRRETAGRDVFVSRLGEDNRWRGCPLRQNPDVLSRRLGCSRRSGGSGGFARAHLGEGLGFQPLAERLTLLCTEVPPGQRLFQRLGTEFLGDGDAPAGRLVRCRLGNGSGGGGSGCPSHLAGSCFFGHGLRAKSC